MSTIFDLDPPYLLDRVFALFARQQTIARMQHSHQLRPSGLEAKSIRYWVQSNVQEFDLKPTTWAKRAGIAPSTLNRFLEGGDGAGSLNARTINKLSKVIDEEISKIEEQERLYVSPHDVHHEVNECAILGKIDEDSWQKMLTKNQEESEMGLAVLTVPVLHKYVIHQPACFEVASDLYYPTFKKFDTIICSPISKTKIKPSPEQYVVMIEAGQKREFRAFVRQYVQDPVGREWLVPVGEAGRKRDHAMLVDAPASDFEASLKAVFTVVGVHTHLA